MGPSKPVLRLAYHLLSESWPPPLGISAQVLRTHLRLLRERGYSSWTVSEADELQARGELPERSVVITFDDGFASTAAARRILDEFGFRATVFVVTGNVDSGLPFRWRGIELPDESPALDELTSLTWHELRDLAASGWEIGSHTTSHAALTEVDDRELADQLGDSKARIIAELGRCTSIAYPFGRADERVALAARAAGYEVGCTCSAYHDVDEPLRRPRINLCGSDTGIRMRVQFSPLTEHIRRTPVIKLAWVMRRGRSWVPKGE